MGWFDPAYKKMIGKSPAYFQRSATVWGPMIEVAMATHPLLQKAGNLFRAVVVGRLALQVAKEDVENWVPKSVLWIASSLASAEKFLPEPFLSIARELSEEIIEFGTQEVKAMNRAASETEV